MRSIAVIAAALAAHFPVSAAKQVETYTHTFNAPSFGTVAFETYVKKFDGSLGRLVSIERAVDVQYNVFAAWDLRETLGYIDFSGSKQMYVDAPDLSKPYAPMLPQLQFYHRAFSGTAGEKSWSDSYSASYKTSSTGRDWASDAAEVTGAGSFRDGIYDIFSMYGFRYVWGGPFEHSFGGTATFDVTWTYTYSVPEPATWAMMLGGFGLLGAAARRRPRNCVKFA